MARAHVENTIVLHRVAVAVAAIFGRIIQKRKSLFTQARHPSDILSEIIAMLFLPTVNLPC